MHRNLDRRVEVLASITNPAHIAEITELFEMAFDKGTASWKLQPDGTWIAYTTDDQGRPLLDMQDYLINSKSRRRAGRSEPDHARQDLGQPGARFSRPVLAGGAVVSREDPLRGTEVVLIHRQALQRLDPAEGKARSRRVHPGLRRP